MKFILRLSQDSNLNVLRHPSQVIPSIRFQKSGHVCNLLFQDTDQKTIEDNTTYKQPAPKSQSVAKQPKEKDSAATTPVPKESPSNPPSRFKVIPVSFESVCQCCRVSNIYMFFAMTQKDNLNIIFLISFQPW